MGIVEILLAFGPMLADLLPKFAGIFKPQGEVANRNVAAAQVVVDAVVKATGAANAQGAIEAMRKDDATRAAVQAALDADPAIMALVEVGGGVVAARVANLEQGAVPAWKNPALLVFVLLAPLLYMVVYRVLWGEGFTPEMRIMVIAAIVSGLLGSITAFFYGSSLSSARKDELAARRV